VQLVDKQDYVPLFGLQLLDHLTHPLLEVASEAGSRDQCAGVEGEHALVLERLGHLFGYHPLGQPLDDGRLADAGLADKGGVVLRPTTEDAHGTPYLLGAAHHRVELAVAGRLGKVTSDLIQGRRPALRGLLTTRTKRATATGTETTTAETATAARTEATGAGTTGCRSRHRSHLAALLQETRDLTPQRVRVAGAVAGEYLVGVAVALAEQAEEQVLAPDLGRAHLPRRREGKLQRSLGARGKGVDLVTRVAPLPAEVGAHLVHGGAGTPQRLRGDVIAGHNTGEQVIGADSVGLRSPGRSLTSTHNALPCLAREGFEEVARPLILLLHKVLQHLERIASPEPAPDHAELPRTLGAEVGRPALPPLLLGDLHARRPDPAILTYHLLNSLL
jgi:hypothetical protein